MTMTTALLNGRTHTGGSSPNAWCNEVSVATVFSSAVF